MLDTNKQARFTFKSFMRNDAYISKATFINYLAVFPLWAIYRLWAATIRIEASPDAVRNMSAPERLIGLAWHSRIFFLPICKFTYRKNFAMSGLVSASKDGAWLCAFFRFLGIGAVRGSYKRHGVTAIMGLVDTLKTGDVFITPDGPRGPNQVAKRGFVQVARESGARILALKITPTKCLRVKSWDGFMLPLPFSKVIIETRNFENLEALENAAAAANKKPEEFVGDWLNTPAHSQH